MNQKLTFTAFLQDEYSKNFDRLASRTDADIKKIEKNLSQLGKTGKQTSRSIDDLNKRIEVLTKVRRMTIDTRAIKFATAEIKKLQQEKEKLEGMGKTGGRTSVFDIAGGIGVANVAGRVYDSIKGFALGSADAYMNYEAIVESFKVLTKSDNIGTGLAERLNKWQQDTILGPEVFKAAQTLLSFGVGINHVEKDLLALGNVSQGNADKLQSLTLAFAQTQSAGRLMGQDLLQYVNAGFNPLQTISERWQEFGFKSQKTVGQLRKDMENGAISSDMIRKAFELATTKGGLFDGMLQKMGATTFGSKKQLEGQYEAFKIAFGERSKGLISGIVGGLSNLLGTMKRMIEIPVSEKIREELRHLQSLRVELDLNTTSERRRKEILEEVKRIQPDIIDGTRSEKEQLEQLTTSLDNYIGKKKQQLALQTIKEEYASAASDYKSALNYGAESEARIYTAIAQAKEMGLNVDGMSRGQATIAARRFFNQRIESGNLTYINKNDSIRKRNSIEYKSIGDLNSGVDRYNEAMERLEKAKPGYQKFLDTQKELTDLLGDVTEGKGGADAPTGNNNPAGGGSTGAGASISGSSKITHLVINIDSLIKGGVNIYEETTKTGAYEMKEIVAQQLLTAVNDANLAVGN